MRVGLLVAVASVCALAVGQAASASGSGLAVAYQVDVAHSGVQSDDALAPPFSRRWKVTLPGPVSYPLIAGGYVYVTVGNTSNYGTQLYALRQSDGSVAWSTPISGTYFWSNAAYDAGRVFVVNTDGLLRAFAGDTGALAWAMQLPGQYSFSSAPTASNGVVYVGGAGSGGTLYAVDESNGGVLATQPVMNGDDSSPALSGSAVFVSYACNQAYGFATPSLDPLWHYSTSCEGGGGKTTVYANGQVYTRDFFGNLVLDAATGNLIRSWAPQGSPTPPAPAVDSSTIYSLSGGSLTAQAVSDGSVSWTFGGDGQLDTAPLVLATSGGEFVVEGSSSGRLYALRASTGAVAWQTDVGSAIAAPDEQNVSQPLTGLGAGQGMLVVPAGSTVSAYARDTTPPTINVPPTVTAKGTSSNGAVVTYTVTASDPDDTATVSCSPASGSVFPIGWTTVSCTATDTAGNTSSASFLVVVSAPGADCNLAHYPSSKGALNLKNANLSGCYLPGANLVGANATAANLTGTYLDHANLSGANLTQASLQRSWLANANFSNAKLNFANLTGAKTTGATFTGASWVQTTCPDGTNSNNDGGTCIGHL
jgi:outer membrane protein assembly factor BamB